MNDIESIKDCLIADEIQHIQSLSREQLVRELVEVRSTEIEHMNVGELLNKCKKQYESN